MSTQTSREEACVQTLAKLADKQIKFTIPKALATDFDRNEPEGLFYLFKTLNDTFFGGVFKRGLNLKLEWADGEPGTAYETFGLTRARGAVISKNRRTIMITITLNRDLCSVDTCDREGKALAALIHQMGHAYFLLRCGAKDGTNIHDEHFKALMVSISDIIYPYESEVAAFLLMSIGKDNKLESGNPEDHCEWHDHPDMRPVFPRRAILGQEIAGVHKRAEELAEKLIQDQKEEERMKKRARIKEFFSFTNRKEDD
ncbi:hypothetical protein AAP_03855 [Ascosphaera apis ARSEF 7405]|uniref:Uncharacterized protein n=1 Tax=Ascosphaera apis ARSEF 7405 TaxID=392613 RepID=A0A167XPQ4_9EURO|nr:hypothetical protein AAP_03855 [Ascosphaera apis ARSEF 7405]